MMQNETQVPYSDEIDLVEFVQTLWDGKFKIAGVIATAVLGVAGFFFTQPDSSFIAKTEIKPITSAVANLYHVSNSWGFFEVYSGKDKDKDVVRFLDELFLEQLDAHSLFEDAFRKYAVLNKNNYETETDFNKAIIASAAGIRLLPPINVDGTAKGESRRHWTIEFEFNDKEKWLNVLSDVKAKANQNVRELIRDNFITTLAAAEKNKAYEIEDMSTTIDNALIDYERKASDRVAFLQEQSAIARKLVVKNNTIETQSFGGKNSVVTNVKTDTPFYLRGYEAIEKEIELIESRDNKKAFVDGFLELEQKKRRLEQDKTLERAEALFADTPVMSGDDFSAVVMTVASTEFEFKRKRMLMLAIAVVLGGIVGTVYVLIANAMRRRKEKLA